MKFGWNWTPFSWFWTAPGIRFEDFSKVSPLIFRIFKVGAEALLGTIALIWKELWTNFWLVFMNSVGTSNLITEILEKQTRRPNTEPNSAHFSWICISHHSQPHENTVLEIVFSVCWRSRWPEPHSSHAVHSGQYLGVCVCLGLDWFGHSSKNCAQVQLAQRAKAYSPSLHATLDATDN